MTRISAADISGFCTSHPANAWYYSYVIKCTLWPSRILIDVSLYVTYIWCLTIQRWLFAKSCKFGRNFSFCMKPISIKYIVKLFIRLNTSLVKPLFHTFRIWISFKHLMSRFVYDLISNEFWCSEYLLTIISTSIFVSSSSNP